jgi:hypothetical protein
MPAAVRNWTNSCRSSVRWRVKTLECGSQSCRSACFTRQIFAQYAVPVDDAQRIEELKSDLHSDDWRKRAEAAFHLANMGHYDDTVINEICLKLLGDDSDEEITAHKLLRGVSLTSYFHHCFEEGLGGVVANILWRLCCGWRGELDRQDSAVLIEAARYADDSSKFEFLMEALQRRELSAALFEPLLAEVESPAPERRDWYHAMDILGALGNSLPSTTLDQLLALFRSSSVMTRERVVKLIASIGPRLRHHARELREALHDEIGVCWAAPAALANVLQEDAIPILAEIFLPQPGIRETDELTRAYVAEALGQCASAASDSGRTELLQMAIEALSKAQDDSVDEVRQAAAIALKACE